MFRLSTHVCMVYTWSSSTNRPNILTRFQKYPISLTIVKTHNLASGLSSTEKKIEFFFKYANRIIIKEQKVMKSKWNDALFCPCMFCMWIETDFDL